MDNISQNYISVGLVNWEIPKESPKFLQVYINSLELKALCFPSESEKEMLTKISALLKCQETSTEASIPQSGHFIKAGTLVFFDNDVKRKAKNPEETKSINFYINAPKVNNNGLTPHAEKIAEQISQFIIRRRDEELEQKLREELVKAKSIK